MSTFCRYFQWSFIPLVVFVLTSTWLSWQHQTKYAQSCRVECPFSSPATVDVMINRINGSQVIPKNLFFTFKTGLDACNPFLPSSQIHERMKNMPHYAQLLLNVRKSIAINPQYNVMCFNDEQAYEFTAEHYSREFANMIRDEPRGMLKGDMFRLVFLYVKGGVYVDVDLEFLTSLDDWIHPHATLVSSIGLRRPDVIFQAILGATPRNEIIRRNLEKWKDIKQHGVPKHYTVNVGTHVMAEAIQNFTGEHDLFKISKRQTYKNERIQLLAATSNQARFDTNCVGINGKYKHVLYDQEALKPTFCGRFWGFRNSVGTVFG